MSGCESCKQFCKEVAYLSLATGGVALTAFVLHHPIGLVGGAIAGAAGSLAGRIVFKLSDELLKLLKLSDSVLAQMVMFAVAIFAAFSAASIALATAGYGVLTVQTAIVLKAGSEGIISGVLIGGAIVLGMISFGVRRICYRSQPSQIT